MSNFQSWGRYPESRQEIKELGWIAEIPSLSSYSKPVLPYGQGRSYGDSCLNDQGILLSTRFLDKFLVFDAERGLLRAEAGVTLEKILSVIVPEKWFLPVSPGTKFVSLGGAIANDVHGKNHHRAGTFGCHVTQFELLRSDGQKLLCSLDKNQEMFKATIGGLGLTGLILWAEIQLKPIKGPFIDTENIKFSSLDEFFDISTESDKDFEHTVSWLDCVSDGKSFGRGLFMRGNHSAQAAPSWPSRKSFAPGMPFNLPQFVLNKYSIKAFNALYYAKQRQKVLRRCVHYEPFFYPLDSIANWNRMYGKKGFMQFQLVLPESCKIDGIKEVLKRVVRSGQASFLAVIKEFGDIKSPGMMSFPRPGITLCLDFANRGNVTLELLRDLDTMVKERGGAVYPAKDACMGAESFERYFTNLAEFKKYVDPAFSSSFYRRVAGKGRDTDMVRRK